MRPKFAVAVFLLLVSAESLVAQTFDEQGICALIAKPGLFYASTQPSYRYEEVNGKELSYDRDARFVLITAPAPPQPGRDYEGVWHVRTQTIAELSKRANKTYVYRPPVTTRCSGGPLPSLERGDRLVTLTEYLDHHLSDPSHPRQKSYNLSRRFHMPIQDVAANDCVSTDNDKAFDLNGTYGFSDVNRRDLDSAFEFATTLVPRAYAANVTYHGLSSEFAYRDTPHGVCVSFASPIPTGPVPHGWFSNAYDDAMQAAAVWKPKSTQLVIKRLEGRRVITLPSKTITWAKP